MCAIQTWHIMENINCYINKEDKEMKETLQVIGAVAKVIGGLAGAGMGMVELKELCFSGAPSDDDFDFDSEITVDVSSDVAKTE